MKNRRAVIYCRVDRGGSFEMRQGALNAQKRKLKRFAENKGLKITGYYEDNGSTGHDMQRPGLNQMRKDGEAGAFEMVLVVNRSRLFRGNRWTEPRWPFQVCSMNQLEQNMER